ncbi:unnamed protein product [Choristocarpus tenellus]
MSWRIYSDAARGSLSGKYFRKAPERRRSRFPLEKVWFRANPTSQMWWTYLVCWVRAMKKFRRDFPSEQAHPCTQRDNSNERERLRGFARQCNQYSLEDINFRQSNAAFDTAVTRRVAAKIMALLKKAWEDTNMENDISKVYENTANEFYNAVATLVQICADQGKITTTIIFQVFLCIVRYQCFLFCILVDLNNRDRTKVS